MTSETDDEFDLSKETVDLSQKDEKAPKSSSGSGSMPILDAGSEFAGYQIIRKIAHGAMGVVYLAEDPKLRRKVALKVILTVPGMQATEEQVNRFLREARSIAKLRHKRIVPVYEVNSFDNCHYFTMEYIEGPTLEQYLLKNDITAAKAIEIVLAIAEGLQEAHEKNIVHRDIKPANIIMQNGESPMITDFGLAKILEHEQKLTMTGSMLGTPCYMSPEQARGDADLDYRSDIFSLGVLLYEMVTEKLPFKGESYMKTILIVINGDYIMPRKIKPRLSRDVESIIKKALEKDREFRYQSMVDFIDDCARFQRGEVVTISRSGIYRKILRNVVKQRNSIIMSTCIVLIIGYLMYKNFDQSLTVNEQLQDKERAKQQASLEKELISKKNKELELKGELLKKGTTSPEFTERFDNPKYFGDNWFVNWQNVDIKKNTLIIPNGKNLILTPTRAEGFSSSAIFSWKLKIPIGNKLIFFSGKPATPDGKTIESPTFIIFQVLKNNSIADMSQDREPHLRLRILFYQTPNKTNIDRTSFNVMDLLATQQPLASKIIDLPENASGALNFSVKRHETFFEIAIKEKEGVLLDNDKSFQEVLKISSASYLNPAPLQFGFYIPETNKTAMELEKLKVEKWITGTSEIEINRIVESFGRTDYRKLFSQLQRHQEQLETAWYETDNPADVTNLKYQLAKTSFLMGVAIHRNLNFQSTKDDVKLVADNYEKALKFTQEYIAANEKSKKTEYLNYEDLYLSVLVQTAYLNFYLGDFVKAGELIKKHREYAEDNTPFNNWLWNLPEQLDKIINQVKAYNKPKLGEKYNEIFSFLRQFSFASEAGELTDTKRFLKDMLKNSVELNDLDLFDKFNSLTIDDSNKAFLQEIIVKEVVKEKINSLLVLNTLRAANKTFKVEEAIFVGNYKYEKWSTLYPEKETRSWPEYIEALKNNQNDFPLFARAQKMFPEFAGALNQNGEQNFEKLNALIDNEPFRKKVLTNILDDLLIDGRKKASGGVVQALGETFPMDLNFDQNRGGNINLALEEKGIRIGLITKDFELKNKYSGNMLQQQDCWELYFDFRHEQQFLSNQDGPGTFKMTYVPAPNEIGEARFYFNENAVVPEIKVLSYINPNRGIPQNEVVFFLPFSEIIRITNNPNIKYFAFNAVLNLESKEKSSFRVLFGDVPRRIFFLSKNPINVANEPLLSDKDLINELQNVYQQYGDPYIDRIMIKKILDNWLNVVPLKPLINGYQFEKIGADFLAVIGDDSKRGQVKKTIDEAQLFFGSNSMVIGANGLLRWKDPFAKSVFEKVCLVLDINLSNLDKKVKAPTVLEGELFWEEIKRGRQLLKYADNNGRKSYWRFLERYLNYLKENQTDLFETVHSFLVQIPESDLNLREKAITSLIHGNIPEAHNYLKKHLDSDYWKDDDRVWFEHQLVTKIMTIMNNETKTNDEELKEKSNYFNSLSQQSRNIENDLALVFDKRMKVKEFMAKYPQAESAINLINTINSDASPIKKMEDIRTGYENVLKTVTVPWLNSILKKRLAELHK